MPQAAAESTRTASFRTRIKAVRADGPLLRVRACGTDLALPAGEDLSGRAARLLSPR
ncbi:hypothetical protein [Streptomyces sp. NBC_01262]|uniref:hypothetical protein n=1 Tax=Streptomyces sp. NBC_01262 TaxID=2903803 RepID=UPI002E34E2A6|nr:hypothetical protein [Streptomyces sp. NBC_01262]